MNCIVKLALVVALSFAAAYANGSLTKSMLASRESYNVEKPIQFDLVEVEWLVPTNKAFIMLDWYINEMTAVSITFCKTGYSGSLYVCGKENNWSDSPPWTFCLTFSNDSIGFKYAISSSKRASTTNIGRCGVTSLEQWATLEYINDIGDGTFSYIVNGQVVAFNTSFYPSSMLSSQPLLFLAEYNNTADPKTSGGQFTSDKIRIAHGAFWRNGELYQDLIPVRFTNESGEAEGAFWCRVQNRLYRNVRVGGSFVVGPDKQ